MTQDQVRWQDDGRRAFEWIAQVYTQAGAVWNDAQSTFEGDGWRVQKESGRGGAAMGNSLHQWPFMYLKAFCATPPEVSEGAVTGFAAVFGLFFYDSTRQGPQCFGGRVNWSTVDANLNHWFLYHAMGGASESRHHGLYEWEQSQVPGVWIARPTEKERTQRPGADELRWFELPLSFLTSAEELRNVIKATQTMARGDEQFVRELLRRAKPGEEGSGGPFP